MYKSKILKKVKPTVVLTFLSAFAIFSSFSSIESKAGETYYIRALFDEGSFGIVSQIIHDKGEGKVPLERTDGVNFSNILDYTKSVTEDKESLIVDIKKKNPETSKEDYKAVLEDVDDNIGLTFSFPGITTSKYTAMSSDSARAELVGNTLSKGANDALAFIKTYTKAEQIGAHGLRVIADKLGAMSIKVQKSKTGSDTFNTGDATRNRKGFSIYKITGANQKAVWAENQNLRVGDELIPVNGLRYSDYVAIGTTVNGEGTPKVYGYFPWRMEKGYYDGQALASLVGEDYVNEAQGEKATDKEKAKPPKENKYITWAQLFIQAGVNADLRGTISVDNASDAMTLVGQGLGADLTATITSVRSILNLAPTQELVLNMGSRDATHHHGVMTKDMYNTAKTVYALTLVVSLLFLSVLVIRMVHQKMISTTNIIARTSLMEGLQDIVFVGVMLAVFPSMFELLLELNYWIVETFSFSSSYLQAYGITGAKVLGMESLAGFMISSMFLSIDAYINTTYLVRAIVVSFLFAISPIMTVSYAWGPMQKKLYFGYMRELVGNIFMQSFHAITMTFFAGYNTTNMSAMEAIASTYCFIPITQLFRSLVIGSQGGFSEQLGGKLAGQLTNTATGMHKSSVAMRQSKEMMELQADNAKNIADANWKAQRNSTIADLASMGINSNSLGEIGQAVVGKMSGSSKSKVKKAGDALGAFSSSTGGKVLTGAGRAMGGATVNLIGAKNANNLMTNAHQDANQKLGEMQMKHSMENIGVGLAQAGMGIGMSSYDTGAGNSMVGAGMSAVERNSASYGEGLSNAGTGGTLLAQAEGTNASARAMRNSLMMTAGRTDRYFGDMAKGSAKNREENAKEQKEIDTRGISKNEALYMTGARAIDDGGKFTNDTNPVISYQASKVEKNTITQTLDLKKLDENYARGNASLDYVKTWMDKKFDFNDPDVQKAGKLAEKDGMNMSYGTNGIGGYKPGEEEAMKQITIVTRNVQKDGFEVTGKGATLKTNSNIDTE